MCRHSISIHSFFNFVFSTFLFLLYFSSAPEEDGTGASFAGAFETQLGVAGTFVALETAIRACFASLWDYRVLDYKMKNSPKAWDEEIGFALVIMEMLDSKIAGVAFTANPLNSDRDEAVIDSVRGGWCF